MLDGIMSDLRNKCEGHGLINRPPMSPYLHDCWWRNEPPITLKEAKSKKEGVPSDAWKIDDCAFRRIAHFVGLRIS